MLDKVSSFVVQNPALTKKIGAGIGLFLVLLAGGTYLLLKDDPEEFYGPPYDNEPALEEE